MKELESGVFDIFAGRKVVSLWDMRDYFPDKIVHVLARIAAIKENVVHHRAVNPTTGVWPKEQREQCQAWLDEALPPIEELGLSGPKALVKQLNEGIGKDYDLSHAEQAANDIRLILEVELKSRKMFILDGEFASFYSNPLLAGEQFKGNFPKANIELFEAGNCIALDRYTASACHLMRSVEFVLRAFEDSLGIPPSPRDNWGGIMRKIEEKRGKKESQSPGLKNHPAVLPSAEWEKNPKFNEDCHAYILGVKASCRDKVFHVVSTYEKTGARQLFDSAKSFLSKAAEHLKEPS